MEDRLLVVNLGRDLYLRPAPEPLLAPPEGGEWKLIFSSESPCFGGSGTVSFEPEGNWLIPGNCTVVFTSEIATNNNGKHRSQNRSGASAR